MVSTSVEAELKATAWDSELACALDTATFEVLEFVAASGAAKGMDDEKTAPAAQPSMLYATTLAFTEQIFGKPT